MGRSRRRLTILAILSLSGLAVAFTVFVIRFDPDRYRPYLESRLSKALNLQVELGHLSGFWTKGLGLRGDRFQVRRNRNKAPLFVADSVHLWLDPVSLLGGRLIYKTKVVGGEFHYRTLRLRGIRTELRQQIPAGKMEGMGEGRILSDSASDLKWRAVMDPKSREVDWEVHFEQDKAFLRGEAFPFQKPPRFQATLELQGFDLATAFRLWNAAAQTRAPLAGVVFGTAELAGVGGKGGEIRKSLQGKGELEIRNGAFQGFNIVNAILKRVTIVPPLGEVLVAGAPARFQPLFNQQDTPFELLQAQFVIQEEQVTFQRLLFKDRQYLIEAEGVLGFQGEVNFRAKLILMEEVSQFLVERVKELSALRNAKGRMVIPFVYRGRWPHARPRPDLGYLAENLFFDQGARLVERGLEALSQQLRKSPP